MKSSPVADNAILISLLNASSEAVVIYDEGFRFLYLNIEAERLLGASQEAFLGKVLWDLFPDRAAPFHEPLTRAMRERIALTFESEYVPTRQWTEGRCLPLNIPGNLSGNIPGESGSPTAALAVFFRNVTDRHRAEASRKRMEFLAKAGTALSSSLDYQVTLESMARLVVPDLCDWCAVQMPSADGAFIENVAVAHVDPDKVQWARELNRRYPTRIDETRGVAQVLRTGEAVFMPDVPDEALAAGAKDEEHLRLIREIGFRSAIAVPLIARSRIFGVLLFVTVDESGRRLDESDLAFVQELAARAAVAVDNARLFQEAQAAEQEVRHLLEREHNIAERLQHSLQPTLPDRVAGLELDAYYQPALHEASIGGDFYDVFSIEEGCLALVVADLSGKGLAAAAQVATVRHMLRALLYQQKTSIAEALMCLNEMLYKHDLLVGFATLFVGVYNVQERILNYASCGHEPGLVLRHASGGVEELGPTGPVLGGFPGAVYEEQAVSLLPGDVLAIFTDGLTEAGTSRKDLLGIPGLISVFQECHGMTDAAGDITTRVIAGVEKVATPGGIRDDVCLLVACIK